MEKEFVEETLVDHILTSRPLDFNLSRRRLMIAGFQTCFFTVPYIVNVASRLRTIISFGER